LHLKQIIMVTRLALHWGWDEDRWPCCMQQSLKLSREAILTSRSFNSNNRKLTVKVVCSLYLLLGMRPSHLKRTLSMFQCYWYYQVVALLLFVCFITDPQWGESGLSLYNSNKLTFLLRRITPICVASTSVSAISQTPWNTACWSWHDVPVLFQNPAWQAQTDTAVSLWVSRAKYQFHLWSSSWSFCNDSPEWRSRHMVTWFGRHGDAFGTTENASFRAFITLRSQFHLHHCSQRALTEIVSKITPNLRLVL